jgi:hypothetical protein
MMQRRNYRNEKLTEVVHLYLLLAVPLLQLHDPLVQLSARQRVKLPFSFVYIAP